MQANIVESLVRGDSKKEQIHEIEEVKEAEESGSVKEIQSD